MKIVFLAANDPIYLPGFFERVLSERARSVAAVFAVPPLYKGQSSAQAAWRYFRTFGAGATVGLVRKLAGARRHGQSIEAVCARYGVPYGVREDVNAPEFLDELRGLGCDVVVSVSCPQIFQRELIELPERGCLNIHGAILPAYRGVMPSFWMLANGERQAGVTIFFVNEDIDAGDVCGQRIFEIGRLVLLLAHRRGRRPVPGGRPETLVAGGAASSATCGRRRRSSPEWGRGDSRRCRVRRRGACRGDRGSRGP